MDSSPLQQWLQGLNTSRPLTDPEGKLSGWQNSIGDQGDHDVKFFDAALESLQKGFREDSQGGRMDSWSDMNIASQHRLLAEVDTLKCLQTETAAELDALLPTSLPSSPRCAKTLDRAWTQFGDF